MSAYRRRMGGMIAIFPRHCSALPGRTRLPLYLQRTFTATHRMVTASSSPSTTTSTCSRSREASDVDGDVVPQRRSLEHRPHAARAQQFILAPIGCPSLTTRGPGRCLHHAREEHQSEQLQQRHLCPPWSKKKRRPVEATALPSRPTLTPLGGWARRVPGARVLPVDGLRHASRRSRSVSWPGSCRGSRDRREAPLPIGAASVEHVAAAAARVLASRRTSSGCLRLRSTVAAIDRRGMNR